MAIAPSDRPIKSGFGHYKGEGVTEVTDSDRLALLEHQNGTLLYLSGCNLIMNVLTIILAAWL
jgi:hypothetical protein